MFLFSWGDIISETEKILGSIDIPVIVEGKRDKQALQAFGVENIYTLSGKPLHKVAYNISKSHEKVLVLTDFDKEGIKLSNKLGSYLTSYGVRQDRKKRKKLRKELNEVGISQIEDLRRET